MRSLLFGTRRRKVAAVAVAALTITGCAVAAFVVFTGVDGSGQGTFDTASTSTAITINGTSQPVIPSANSTADMNVQATNNDPDASHSLSTLAGTFTSSPSECAAHLHVSLTGATGITGSYAAGQTKTGTVQVTFDNTAPSTCAGGTWSVQFGGTTTP